MVALVARTLPHIVALPVASARYCICTDELDSSYADWYSCAASSRVPNTRRLALSAEPMRGALGALLPMKLRQTCARPVAGATATS
eukprot:COSAG02_NODE_3019_length_7535_cov_9.178456_2_plen_86_part_00